MISKSMIRTSVIISAAVLAGGCQLINPKSAEVKIVKPTPTPSTSSLSSEIYTPVSTPEPTAVPATQSAVKNTPKPQVKGTTTTSTKTVTTRISPLYDTSFDTWEITNFPGQEYEKELTLYNKTDKKVLFAARAADRFSDFAPVSVNGSYEATGEILPQAIATIKLKAFSSDKNPSFQTNVTINFVNENNQIVSTRTVKVTAHTPVGDRANLDSNNDGNKTGDATMNITYSANKAYPIRLNNKHSYKVNWTAKFASSESDGKLVLSAKSGSIEPNSFWDTDIHFTTKDIGPMTQAVLAVTFTRDGGSESETKTMTINVNR
jgi:hypothetical protein